MSNSQAPGIVYTMQGASEHAEPHASRTGDPNDDHNAQLLVDTSSLATGAHQHAQAPLLPAHHLHEPLQPQVVCSQPPASTARVAPEDQGIVYSVHPSFESLDALDALYVRQRVNCERTCCGFESENGYTVRAKDGSPVLRAVEKSSCCERCCFEANREYSLKLMAGEEVVARVVKPFRVARFCCYSNALRIESPEDNPIGFIKQQFAIFGHSKYAVFDAQYADNKPMFVVESQSCRFCCRLCLSACCCPNRSFRVLSAVQSDPETGERRQVATIARNFESELGVEASWTRAMSPTSNSSAIELQPPQQQHQQLESIASDEHNSIEGANGGDLPVNCSEQHLTRKQVRVNPANVRPVFGIQFDANLDLRHKVLLLAACFMMDFFYFETDRRRKKLTKC